MFEVTDLFQKYPTGGDFVLKGIRLQIKQGSFNILLGQNGSGKSSLMKCLAGIQPWSKGEIFFNGQDRGFDRPDFNRGLMFVSEDIALPNYSLETLTRIYEEIWGRFDRSVFDRILSYGRIDSKSTSAGLSRGQKALTQFALTLAIHAETLLIDEITAVLDPYVRARVVDELLKYNRENGSTIIVATNIATEFAGVSGNAILIEAGKIYLNGPVDELANEFVVVDVPVGGETAYPGFVILSNRSSDQTRLIGRRGPVDPGNGYRVTLEEMFIFLSARKAS